MKTLREYIDQLDAISQTNEGLLDKAKSALGRFQDFRTNLPPIRGHVPSRAQSIDAANQPIPQPQSTDVLPDEPRAQSMESIFVKTMQQRLKKLQIKASDELAKIENMPRNALSINQERKLPDLRKITNATLSDDSFEKLFRLFYNARFTGKSPSVWQMGKLPIDTDSFTALKYLKWAETAQDIIMKHHQQNQEESVDEAASPDAVRRIEQLVQYK